jgi:D-alanyl-D-alanine carboxypeptidase
MAFGIGSNTKTFTSCQILKLEEQSLISLDDTVGTWIQHPNVNGQITVKQLLNHTSGLYNFTNSQAWADSLGSDWTRVWQPEEVLQFIGTPYFSPGASWQYSNSNYLLLGLIIKQITGQPLSTNLRNSIFTPAGLNNTWLIPEESTTATIPHVWSAAFSGSFLQDVEVEYGYSNTGIMSMAWSAGAIVSTASDNATFWSKLITGQVLTPASLVKMKQIVPTTPYGLGIFRRTLNGRTIYCHGGTNLGFINENLADSISGAGISVLTNQDSVSNNTLFTKVVAALHKVTINPPTAVTEVRAALGFEVYPNPANGSISIAGLEDGAQATLQIIDMTGRVVCTKHLSSFRDISLPSLVDGIYTLHLTTEKGSGNSILNIRR